MSQPKQTPHVLLCTTGASPQVVTETLYAIHQEGGQWPDQIRLITTSFGFKKAEKGLLAEGHLARLCHELQRDCPKFSSEDIKVVPDASGKPVEDARSLEDHEALADFIMTQVRDLTVTDKDGQPVNTLHASLAGGRKTMTFYLGYAMSLFGRRGDLLSHVLISKEFEDNPGFWFPTQAPEHRYLRDRDGERIDACDAKVTLAPIPFIRHRQELPVMLPQNGTSVHFRDLVRLINLGDLPEEVRLVIDLPSQRIIVRDNESPLKFEFKPGALALAFYSMMARATLSGETEITRPSKKRAHAGLRKDLFDELLPLCGLPREPDGAQALARLIDWNELQAQFKDNTLEALSEGVTSTWFDQRKTELRKLFRHELPGRLSDLLTPELIWSEAGEPLARPGSTKGGGYGIALPVANITLIEATAK